MSRATGDRSLAEPHLQLYTHTATHPLTQESTIKERPLKQLQSRPHSRPTPRFQIVEIIVRGFTMKTKSPLSQGSRGHPSICWSDGSFLVCSRRSPAGGMTSMRDGSGRRLRMKFQGPACLSFIPHRPRCTRTAEPPALRNATTGQEIIYQSTASP